MTMTPLNEYVEQAERSGSDTWLGSLIWYSVIEAMIPHKMIVDALDQSGLSAMIHESMIPRCPQDYDVFRRVSSNAELKKVPVPGHEGRVRNYLVREVAGRSESIIVRRIVCETVDRKARELSYNTDLCDVEFNRDTATISVKQLTSSLLAPPDPIVDGIVATIQSEFDAQRGRLNAYAVRELLRKLVLSFGATCVKENGGLYFLSDACVPQIEALEAFVGLLSGSSYFHTIPLLDDRKQRDMIKRAFESETCDTIHRTLGEIEELLRTGKKVSVDRYGKMLAEYKEVKDRTAGYADLLETGLIETHSALDLYELQMKLLRKQMKDS